LPGWRFDVITLLAVIGESSVAEHAQTLTASSLCLLPRIIPAPQALLRANRPPRLPEVTAKMTGVYGGTNLDTVGFFANIMHPLSDLKAFSFQVLEIKHAAFVRPIGARAGTTSHQTRKGLRSWVAWGRKKVTTSFGSDANGTNAVVELADVGAKGRATGAQQSVHFAEEDPERGIPGLGPPRRTGTARSKFTDVVTNPTMVNKEESYSVPPSYYSPVHMISVFSFLLTVGVLVAAGLWRDGTAVLAICLISLAGSVICYASLWQPVLMQRRTSSKVPPGDVVIRTRAGAFLLIRCTEEVARELYSGTEECEYVSKTYHRAFMGLGMVLLMVSVVLLGNCTWDSQVLVGSSYIILNGLYWLMGLLPPRYFWDLSRYDVRDVTPEDAKNAEMSEGDDPHEGTASFTRTLWYAIRETKHVAWAERSGALPGTEQWKKWLREARDAAWNDNRKWEAVKRKNEIMKEDLDASSPVEVDQAAQQVPLLQVQPPPRGDGQGTGI
jgi:hypothetical protein